MVSVGTRTARRRLEPIGMAPEKVEISAKNFKFIISVEETQVLFTQSDEDCDKTGSLFDRHSPGPRTLKLTVFRLNVRRDLRILIIPKKKPLFNCETKETRESFHRLLLWFHVEFFSWFNNKDLIFSFYFLFTLRAVAIRFFFRGDVCCAADDDEECCSAEEENPPPN